jgi:hypothetical protein
MKLETEGTNMFQPLNEQIDRTEGARYMHEELVRFTGVAAISAVLFGGLLLIVLMLE